MSGFHKNHLVGDALGKGEFVRDDDHRESLLSKVLQNREHVTRKFRVKSGCGLIEVNDVWIASERSCDGYALLLASREFTRIGVFAVCQGKAGQQLMRLSLRQFLFDTFYDDQSICDVFK